jgi:hypothetical protein
MGLLRRFDKVIFANPIQIDGETGYKRHSLEDGSIVIEFAYHNADEAFFEPERVTSSIACQQLLASRRDLREV